jgi:hypothetical protein
MNHNLKPVLSSVILVMALFLTTLPFQLTDAQQPIPELTTQGPRGIGSFESHAGRAPC